MNQRKRLGDLLVEYGLITEQQLQEALREQTQSGLKLGDYLIMKGYITEQQKIELLEFQLGIPHVQLRRQNIDEKVIKLVPAQLVKRYQLIPLRIENGKIITAMTDPLDYFAMDELRAITGYEIAPVITTKDELAEVVAAHYHLASIIEDEVAVTVEEVREGVDLDNESSPVVRLVHQMIVRAVALGASDIHIDPYENKIKIRFRIDGALHTEKEYPRSMQNMIVSRLKILSNLNIAEKRLPQDGRFEIEVDARTIDIRISTLPTIHGEKTVLRILDGANAKRKVSELGFSSHNEAAFEKIIHSPHGIVLITGPTGSGKTTTLYSALNQLNKEDTNIITIEDPVEYHMEGINQVQVNTATGLTFASGLRTILRQDPNIVMVGEIRDKETAEMAIRAALTGHLVLSTIHTNDSISTINRLVDMGIEPFLISSSLRGVIAQRLVRRICSHCKRPIAPTPDITELFAAHGVALNETYQAIGCNNCNHTGYRGRIAIHEVLLLDEDARKLVLQNRPNSEYQEHLSRQSYRPMFIDGLEKVSLGLTTIQELLRVTMD